jgi:hypothetical protein
MLNHALREGMDYREIIARVETLAGKFHGVTPAKLSAWFRTGYADWLRQKTHLEDTIAQSEAALLQLCRLKKETGASLPDLMETLLVSFLQKILNDLDPAALKTLLADKPAEIFRLMACLNAHIAACSRHSQAEVARVRCQVQLAEKAQAADKEPVPARNLWEAEMIRHAFGSPYQQFMRDIIKPAVEKEEKAQKRRAARARQTAPAPPDDDEETPAPSSPFPPQTCEAGVARATRPSRRATGPAVSSPFPPQSCEGESRAEESPTFPSAPSQARQTAPV